MILTICRWARWLDEWLQQRLGRPYHILLGIGLVSEIVDELVRLGPRLHHAPTVFRTILIVAVEFALVLHLVGGFAGHIERQRGLRRDGAPPHA